MAARSATRSLTLREIGANRRNRRLAWLTIPENVQISIAANSTWDRSRLRPHCCAVGSTAIGNADCVVSNPRSLRVAPDLPDGPSPTARRVGNGGLVCAWFVEARRVYRLCQANCSLRKAARSLQSIATKVGCDRQLQSKPVARSNRSNRSNDWEDERLRRFGQAPGVNVARRRGTRIAAPSAAC